MSKRKKPKECGPVPFAALMGRFRPQTAEEAGFWQALAYAPDWLAWLAYADWLDERNDPAGSRIRRVVRRDSVRERLTLWEQIPRDRYGDCDISDGVRAGFRWVDVAGCNRTAEAAKIPYRRALYAWAILDAAG